MQINRKQQLLGFLIFAFLLMVILVVSLPVVQMEKGQIFSLGEPDQPAAGSSQTVYDFNWLYTVMQAVQVVLIVLAFAYVLISLFDKNARKRLLKDLLRIVLLFILLQFFVNNYQQNLQLDEMGIESPELLDPSDLGGEVVPPSIFEANPQPWMFPLIAVIAAVLLALATFAILLLLSKHFRVEQPRYLKIANNAQKALDEMKEDRFEFSDVIIRCYAEMSQTLANEKDIQRSEAMTTHEFEQDLLSKGFPARPVQQLTRLFEQVRYGHQQPSDNEKHVATQALTDIVIFCRRQA
ncbi:MAG: DUF4129 domain-containing protein [Anaerolineales bacterium]|jgi:uncharacterized membrane protein